jgi:hypothetical protein
LKKIKINITAELEAFADRFQKLSNDPANIIDWAEITLKRNRTIFISFCFYFFIHTLPGTLLSDLIHQSRYFSLPPDNNNMMGTRNCCFSLWFDGDKLELGL